MTPFSKRLKEYKPLVFDGGMGTELFKNGIELANSSVASLQFPDVVKEIHSSYIKAGSDVIGTNTFVASELHLKMAGVDIRDIDKIVEHAVGCAHDAIGKSNGDIYLAGTIGPCPGAIEADSGDVEFGIPNQVVRRSYERLGSSLASAGVDFFCLETMFSAKEAAIAVDSLRNFGLPIAVNLTYKYTEDRLTGEVVYRTDWGHSALDLIDFMQSGEFSNGLDLLNEIALIGLNCGAESKRVEHTGMPYAINGICQLNKAMEIRNLTKKRMMVYPNAGPPLLDNDQRTFYSQTPKEMAAKIPHLLDAGAYFLGGCCGTGPDHIKEYRNAIDLYYENRF